MLKELQQMNASRSSADESADERDVYGVSEAAVADIGHVPDHLPCTLRSFLRPPLWPVTNSPACVYRHQCAAGGAAATQRR